MKFKEYQSENIVHVDDEVWARALIKTQGNCMEAVNTVNILAELQLSSTCCKHCLVRIKCPLNGHMVALAEQYLLDMET